MLSFALMIMLADVSPAHPADLAGLFNADDYPQAAVEADEQGIGGAYFKAIVVPPADRAAPTDRGRI